MVARSFTHPIDFNRKILALETPWEVCNSQASRVSYTSTRLKFSSNDRYLAVFASCVGVIDLSTNRFIHLCGMEVSEVMSVALTFSPDSHRTGMAFVDPSGFSILIWDLPAGGQPKFRVSSASDVIRRPLTQASMDHSGRWMAVGSPKGLLLFEPATQRFMVDPLLTGLNEVSFEDDGSVLATNRGKLRICEATAPHCASAVEQGWTYFNS